MMSKMTNTQAAATHRPPALRRDEVGRVVPASLADLIQWFLSYDQRVAAINYPAVEALFQWKQQETLKLDPETYAFERAEDRLAVGIMQALTEHTSEPALHGWITDLLGALDDAAKTNEAISTAYSLSHGEGTGVLAEAAKIPARDERDIYLTCCWLETLCTAEARVLGWVYEQLYGRPFRPGNF
ncbi:MAG: hypothetical protein H0W76_01235 [Pyrinomonadaceae bacterium]|nr:hypothetical protein [Pyrinomonadaceae bacterium]